MDLRSGFGHAVAVLENGDVYTWGKMQGADVKIEGQVPVYNDQLYPRKVMMVTPFRAARPCVVKLHVCSPWPQPQQVIHACHECQPSFFFIVRVVPSTHPTVFGGGFLAVRVMKGLREGMDYRSTML